MQILPLIPPILPNHEKMTSMKKLILGCCFIICGTQVILTSALLDVMFMFLPNGIFTAQTPMCFASIVLISLGIIFVVLGLKNSH